MLRTAPAVSPTFDALTGPGKVESVRTSAGDLPADIVVMGTKKLPNTRLAREAASRPAALAGSSSARACTPAEGVYAAGDCVEVPEGFTHIPGAGL